MAARKKARKRDKNGHFVKARKAARRAKPKKKRIAKKRTGTVRVKRALGRKRKTGRFTRRAKHRVAGHRRRVKGRSKKKLIRSHLSYENPVKRKRRRRATEASMAQANPRRRKRRASKRRRSPVVMENPRPRKRRRARRAAAAPRRRRRRAMAAYAPNPRKRRRARRRSVTAAVPAVIRRRSSKRGGRSTRSPGRIVVQIAGLGRRTSRKRKSSSRRRKGSSKRKSGKRRVKHRKGYTRKTHQLGMGTVAMSGFFENPIGGNFMENPLSGGELALAGLTGTLGFVLTDMLDRYLAISEYTAAAGSVTNTQGGVTIAPSGAVRTKPGITRILAQAACAAVPLGAAYMVKEPLGRAALQGAGIGALLHLGGQLINHWVMPWIGGKITGVAPLYQMEVQADTAADQWNANVATATALTLSAPPAPKGLGRPAVLRRPTQPSIPFRNPGPFAVAGVPAGVGGCDEPEPRMPVPGPGDCPPCASNTTSVGIDTAAQNAMSLSAPPSNRFNGLGSIELFPEE